MCADTGTVVCWQRCSSKVGPKLSIQISIFERQNDALDDPIDSESYLANLANLLAIRGGKSQRKLWQICIGD